MADIVTFNPLTRLIVEINSGSPSVNELEAVEIYSEWKAWLLGDPIRSGYPQAFSLVGGDPITPTKNLGITYFLENGWRIRPAEYAHKLTIVGNLFTREPGASIFKPTVGSFNVHTETVVSNIIDTITTGGTDPWATVLPASYASNTAGGIVGANIYTAKLLLLDDNTGSADRYVVSWFKNGAPKTSGISGAKIQVVRVADGTDLIPESSMTEIGSLGRFRYSASGGQRISDGAAYLGVVSATIDGQVRVWDQPLGRDS